MNCMYKYCDERGVAILRQLELKVTPPDQFNDPFEFVPRVVSSAPEREVRRLLRNKNELKEWYQEEKRAGYRGNFRSFKQHMREVRPRLVALTPQVVPASNQVMQTNFSTAASSVVGVLCLTSRADSIAMWGHYANKHQGIVIGLDRVWSVFTDSHRPLRPVTYVKTRPKWDPSIPPGASGEREAMDSVIFTKYDEWAYEKEMRQVFRLEALTSRRMGSPGAALPMYFLKIPADCILSVSLGAKASDSFEKEVRSILSGAKFAHVNLFRARLNDSEYSLDTGPA